MEESAGTIFPPFSAEQKLRIIAYLKDYVTPHKQQLVEKVLAERTRYLTLVLEDIFKPHNASAAIRTAECMGIQDIHVIEKTNPYNPNPYVLRGAMKWLTIHKYSTPEIGAEPDPSAVCLSALKARGYQVVATDVAPASLPLHKFVPEKPVALVMGTEYTGISNYVREHADALVTIPMNGFTESLNVSVSAAICLQHLRARLKQVTGWELSTEEKNDLRFNWYRSIPKHADALISHFLQTETHT